jgi:hypothetical protein
MYYNCDGGVGKDPRYCSCRHPATREANVARLRRRRHINIRRLLQLNRAGPFAGGFGKYNTNPRATDLTITSHCSYPIRSRRHTTSVFYSPSMSFPDTSPPVSKPSAHSKRPVVHRCSHPESGQGQARSDNGREICPTGESTVGLSLAK